MLADITLAINGFSFSYSNVKIHSSKMNNNQSYKGHEDQLGHVSLFVCLHFKFFDQDAK